MRCVLVVNQDRLYSDGCHSADPFAFIDPPEPSVAKPSIADPGAARGSLLWFRGSSPLKTIGHLLLAPLFLAAVAAKANEAVILPVDGTNLVGRRRVVRIDAIRGTPPRILIGCTPPIPARRAAFLRAIVAVFQGAWITAVVAALLGCDPLSAS